MSELTYERAKQLYTPYDEGQMRHLCALRDVEIDRLRVENAKLHELVRDMYKAFMHGNCYRWCEFKEPCNFIEDGRCQWYDRMHKLGIEVDV